MSKQAANSTYFYATAQPLGQRSAYDTIIADPGSPYVATFQYTIYILLTSRIFYRFYLCPTSLLRLQTKTNRRNNSSTVHSFLIYSGMCFSRAEKNASRKKWQKLVRLDGLSRFRHQSVELGQLYNICRNQFFSVEPFPCYTTLNSRDKLIYNVYIRR